MIPDKGNGKPGDKNLQQMRESNPKDITTTERTGVMWW